MSGSDYRPRAGSLAHRVIEFLEGAEAGATLRVPQIAEQFGANLDSVTTLLRPSVSAGLLEFVRVGQLRERAYRLAAPVEEAEEAEDEPPGPLAIASDSTGDLWFSGARITTEGAVLLSSEQLQQLVQFATAAPIARQAQEPQP